MTATTATSPGEKRGKSTGPLAGKTVAVSISDSPDLARLGLGAIHLTDAMVEFARHLFALGARIAYGGDLRPGGFTEILFEVARNYARTESEPVENYFAWPIHRRLTAAQLASFVGTAKIHCLDPPPSLVDDPEIYLPPDTPEHRYIWARSLTAMRERMSDSNRIYARIVLGGKLTEFTGRYPGIAEEAQMALEAGQRLYVLGGFGGCARAVVEALAGKTPEAFTVAFQEEESTGYREMKACFDEQTASVACLPIDYEGLVATFHECGFGGLRNGLDAEDNRRLAVSEHLPELIALVLKGLTGPEAPSAESTANVLDDGVSGNPD